MITRQNKNIHFYDFDGCLMNTFEKNEGIKRWEEKTGKKYPHIGWWSKPESLDVNIFDIKPNPQILKEFLKSKNDENTQVIILTARMEKLRSEVERVLDINNIKPDEVVLKKGNETKGDVILNYVKNNLYVNEIIIFDDFAGGIDEKINEVTEIKNKIPKNIKYKIINVINGKPIGLLETIIIDEIIKSKR